MPTMNPRSHSIANPFLAVVGLAFACIAVCGCGSGLKLAAVRGKVLVDGKPYANATVLSYPDTGAVASDRTNEMGEFELSTTGSKGAIPGPHTITVSPHVNEPIPVPGKPIIILKVPYDAKFRSRDYSTLKYEVGRGTNQITVDLTAGSVRVE